MNSDFMFVKISIGKKHKNLDPKKAKQRI